MTKSKKKETRSTSPSRKSESHYCSSCGSRQLFGGKCRICGYTRIDPDKKETPKPDSETE